MAAVGDIARVTARGTFLGQQALNVFFYRIDDPPTATWMDGLITEFQAQVLTEIRKVQTIHYVWTSILVENVFNPAELKEVVVNLPGTGVTSGNAQLASFMAWGFKLLRDNALVRNGRKMIGGLTEELVEGNAPNPATLTILQNNVAPSFAEELMAGGLDAFVPVIVKRIPYVTAEGKDAYRLPESQAEMGANWSIVRAAQFMRLTTMNSRKPGRGN